MKVREQATYEKILLREQQLYLLPEKTIYWKEKNFLILTDLHLGKAGHFRKAGIPIPTQVHTADLDCLRQLIFNFSPVKVLMLGDLFHSDINTEWNDFRALLMQFPEVEFVLVKGNHDILPEEAYAESNLKVIPEFMECAPFYFSHHPDESTHPAGLYKLAGHVHPGYKVNFGNGQSIKLPCYFFGKTGGLLPAFGKFTGCVHVPARHHDQVFAVLHAGHENARVMRVH
ncbi:MAG: ligase-associated DNA damage response endonuclease PdeM [Cyclobacteriaceae bacterium]